MSKYGIPTNGITASIMLMPQKIRQVKIALLLVKPILFKVKRIVTYRSIVIKHKKKPDTSHDRNERKPEIKRTVNIKKFTRPRQEIQLKYSKYYLYLFFVLPYADGKA